MTAGSRRRAHDELSSTSVLLPLKERKKLAAAAPREKIRCPECGEDARLNLADGTWRCVADVEWSVKGQDGPALRVLICGARGLILDGDRVVTHGRYHSATQRLKPKLSKSDRRQFKLARRLARLAVELQAMNETSTPERVRNVVAAEIESGLRRLNPKWQAIVLRVSQEGT